MPFIEAMDGKFVRKITDQPYMQFDGESTVVYIPSVGTRLGLDWNRQTDRQMCLYGQVSE